jgi:hypothetical protein
MADATVTGEPFTFTYDRGANRCSRGLRAAVALAPADLAATLAGFSFDEDALGVLREERDEARRHGDIDRSAVCAAAATMLEHRDGCACPDESWYDAQYSLDQLLSTITFNVWAVTVDGAATDDLTGTLTFERICERAVDIAGWTQVRFAWTGEILDGMFSAAAGEPVTVRLTPLTGERERQYQAWLADDPFIRDAAATLLATPMPALVAAAALTSVLNANNEYPLSTCLDAVWAAGVPVLSVEALEVIAGVAPNWDRPLAELLRALPHLCRPALAA